MQSAHPVQLVKMGCYLLKINGFKFGNGYRIGRPVRNGPLLSKFDFKLGKLSA